MSEGEDNELGKSVEEAGGGPSGDPGGSAGTGGPEPAGAFTAVTITTAGAGYTAVPVVFGSGVLPGMMVTSSAGWTSVTTMGAGGGGAGGMSMSMAVFATPDNPPLPSDGVEVGEIIAWRCWRVEGSAHLRSVSMVSVWEPGKIMEGNPFADACQGIYAYKTEELLRHHFPLADCALVNLVYGRVALWGEVIEHDMGYRAQFAKPLEIWGGEGVEKIGEAYGIPVHRVATPAYMQSISPTSAIPSPPVAEVLPAPKPRLPLWLKLSWGAVGGYWIATLLHYISQWAVPQ